MYTYIYIYTHISVYVYVYQTSWWPVAARADLASPRSERSCRPRSSIRFIWSCSCSRKVDIRPNGKRIHGVRPVY